MFLGISDESKAYKLFDPIAKKIIISRDVIFEEDKSWDWQGTTKECNTNMLDWEEQTIKIRSKDPSSAQQARNDSITLEAFSSSHQTEPSSNETNPLATEDAEYDEHDSLVQGRKTRQRRKPA